MKLIERLFYGATGLVMITAFAIGMHGWGSWVAKNDRAVFAEVAAMQARAVSAVCGRHGEPIKTRNGWRCLRENTDGEMLLTAPLSSPIGAM